MKVSIGRIVHFYSDALATRTDGNNGIGAGPYPAIVTQVFCEGDIVKHVNLKVFPPFRDIVDEGSVSEGADVCPGRYWVWPPRD